jgi:EAL domain-containing protein (putative c-di-GMP-specific phosphodiesterase class I)
LERHAEQQRSLCFDGYIATYLERDLRDLQAVSNLLRFPSAHASGRSAHRESFSTTLSWRAMRCRCALDDFGTGANSLKNLTNLPVDRVKIDGSFVSDILMNPQSTAIVRTIVTLARDLGINTVAEYAETEQIIQRLRELGVEYAQSRVRVG